MSYNISIQTISAHNIQIYPSHPIHPPPALRMHVYVCRRAPPEIIPTRCGRPGAGAGAGLGGRTDGRTSRGGGRRLDSRDVVCTHV